MKHRCSVAVATAPPAVSIQYKERRGPRPGGQKGRGTARAPLRAVVPARESGGRPYPRRATSAVQREGRGAGGEVWPRHLRRSAGRSWRRRGGLAERFGRAAPGRKKRRRAFSPPPRPGVAASGRARRTRHAAEPGGGRKPRRRRRAAGRSGRHRAAVAKRGGGRSRASSLSPRRASSPAASRASAKAPSREGEEERRCCRAAESGGEAPSPPNRGGSQRGATPSRGKVGAPRRLRHQKGRGVYPRLVSVAAPLLVMMPQPWYYTIGDPTATKASSGKVSGWRLSVRFIRDPEKKLSPKKLKSAVTGDRADSNNSKFRMLGEPVIYESKEEALLHANQFRGTVENIVRCRCPIRSPAFVAPPMSQQLQRESNKYFGNGDCGKIT